jgi:hypothetical protein
MTKSLFFLHAFSYKEKTILQIGGLVQCSQIPLEVSFELSPHPHNFSRYFRIFQSIYHGVIVVHIKGNKNLNATFK